MINQLSFAILPSTNKSNSKVLWEMNLTVVIQIMGMKKALTQNFGRYNKDMWKDFPEMCLNLT